MGARKSILFFILYALIQSCGAHPVFAQQSADFAWKITKPSWSSQDEKSFQEFVSRIGEAVEARQCRTVTECMNSPANTYRKSDPPGLRYFADCADYPYYLRAYFAWKNGLPFSMANSMRKRKVPNNQDRDIRYSRYGNEVASRFTTAAAGQFPDARQILNTLIRDMTSSANFRTHYADDKADLFTDYYPVSIDREAIRPGTVIYDPNGHVAVVYRITDDGKALFMDAHPDNSLTTGTYGSKYVRSHPGQGAGFKNWRPQTLVGATYESATGIYRGGKIVGVSNQQLADYSKEQFFGNAGDLLPDERWSEGRFVLDGKPIAYFDYVRQKLSLGNLRIDPVQEFSAVLQDVCDSLKDRVQAVNTALTAGIQNRPHPPRLPDNIYGTVGDWETYSTPSRDAQLKVSFVDLLTQSRDFIAKWKSQDPMIQYSGSNLAQDLLDVYQRESVSCEIAYTNTAGRNVVLNLEQIRQRLFKLSFDPYHCVEFRWGAQTADELQTCRDDANKRLWYERQQRLRNQHIRQYDARMDFSLDELLQPLPGNGVAQPPDVDINRFLQSQILL